MALLSNKEIVCPVLIGREADLAALQALVEQAKRGEGQVALIGGEAGIGKSRLVVTKRTVETHINNILYKLNLTSRAQIVVWAVESGLVTR